MVISSDGAIRKASEFAEKAGWFTLSGGAREDGRLTPSLWRIHFAGDYQDFEIDVNAETGEIFHCCRNPLQTAIDKAQEQLPKGEEEGTLHYMAPSS